MISGIKKKEEKPQSFLCDSCFKKDSVCHGFVSSDGNTTWRTPIYIDEDVNTYEDVHIPSIETGCNGYQVK